MNELLTVDALVSLLTLSLLEIVLGIDNVIFVSIVMGRLPESKQPKARRIWMITGICVRVALLIGLGWLVRNPLAFDILGYRFELGKRNRCAGISGCTDCFKHFAGRNPFARKIPFAAECAFRYRSGICYVA